MSRFDSSTPISPGTTKTGGLRDKEAQKRAKKEKKYTPSKKDKFSGDTNKILKDLDEAQKRKDDTANKLFRTLLQEKAQDQADLNVGAGTGSMQTSEFIEDLKDAYKSGLFTGGTKTKAFMDKYNLDSSDIVKLRTGIDQGLGTRIGGKGGNVLSDIVGDLRQEGILRTSGPGAEFLQQRASEIFEPGMTPYDREPITGLMGLSPLVNIGLKGFDFLAGGSSQGMRGKFYGREVLGLQGEELDNFAASVANDRNLYNQMMSTPEMQEYELNEFRAEANRQARANRDGRGDPNPISGTQPGEDDDDDTTDPGTGADNFIPQQQNFFTFFDPTTGRYRSGTYDEYLKYVTAKDGGIIQLSQGGDDEDPIAENKKVNLRNILAFIRENKDLRKELENMTTETKDQELVKKESQRLLDEEDKTLADMLKQRFSDLEGITGLSVGSPIRTAEKDQPAKDFLNIEIPPNQGPALREDLGPIGRVTDSGISLLMEALRKSDISTGSANQYLEEAMNNFVAAGVIPPNTTYQQLTDPFKDLVTREAAKIAEAENMRQEMSMFRAPGGRGGFQLEGPVYNMIEGMPEKFEQINPVMRDRDVNIMNRTLDRSGDMYNVADGGIIGLKKGGMNDMMEADSLMFKDPSDEGEWEYNV